MICLCQGVLLLVLLVQVLSDSSCIVYGFSMSDLDLVMCIISHLEELKVICQVCSQSISLSWSCCRLSVIVDFSVEHCIVGEKFEGGSWGNMGGHVIYINVR